MQATAFRMLVIYVSGEKVIAGVFNNQMAVFEQIFLCEEKSLAKRSIHLLASLDKEGINLSKLQAVCAPESKNEGDAGAGMACYIAGRLNIPAYFVFSGYLPQMELGHSVYPGDRYLLFLAKQALFMLAGED